MSKIRVKVNPCQCDNEHHKGFKEGDLVTFKPPGAYFDNRWPRTCLREWVAKKVTATDYSFSYAKSRFIVNSSVNFEKGMYAMFLNYKGHESHDCTVFYNGCIYSVEKSVTHHASCEKANSEEFWKGEISQQNTLA